MTGIEIIAEERASHAQRGYDALHDSGHTDGELAIAAAIYACMDTPYTPLDMTGTLADNAISGDANHRWRKNRLRQLAIAGALIAAEIDRLKWEIEKAGEERLAQKQNP